MQHTFFLNSDRQITLSHEEAREMYNQLRELFEVQYPITPATPIIPPQVPVWPYPHMPPWSPTWTCDSSRVYNVGGGETTAT